VENIMMTMTQQIGNLSKEIETIKKDKMEILGLRGIVTEMKISLDVFNSRFEVAEERTSKLEILIVKNPI